MAAIKIGDRVRTLDRQESGTVIEVCTYSGLGDKLHVRLDPPHCGHLLLAIELWELCPARKSQWCSTEQATLAK